MSAGYPFWSETELDQLSADARARFVERYRSEIRAAFVVVEEECAAEVRVLFAATENLRTLGEDPDLFAANRDLLKPARYVTSPVISDDTLKIIGEAEGPAATIRDFLDWDRFPWLAEDRIPSADDPDVAQAVKVTAKLMAEQRLGTKLRSTLSAAQERSVRETLAAAGLDYVDPSVIRERLRELGDNPSVGLTPRNYQEALRRGEFTREIRVAGAKCDVPGRLATGDLLPIECKVSNTAVNSVKRLNRETGGKHERWRGAFGTDLHTAAVLGGVFNLVNLKGAQDDGMLVFFDHDLEAIERFIQAGGRPRPRT
ncbi:MAG: XamI family restriction endonuclease [Solirubrobacterales bacterium]